MGLSAFNRMRRLKAQKQAKETIVEEVKEDVPKKSRARTQKVKETGEADANTND